MVVSNAVAYTYIRFSTDKQGEKDSIRRQTNLAGTWCQDNGLLFDESLVLLDAGLSAFTGKNLEDGLLGKFIEDLKIGKVVKGSYLLVESLDRLSRAQVLEAFELFSKILRNDIIVVTLGDSRTYSKESVAANPMELMQSILIMSRAHEESRSKSLRIREGKKQRLQDVINNGKTTGTKHPGWLEIDPVTKQYKVIEEHVKIMKKIFELGKKGHGAQKISQLLAEEGIFSFNSDKPFSPQTIISYFRDQPVLGYMKDGKTGEYHKAYPSIIKRGLIEPKLYKEAIAEYKERSKNPSPGRDGVGFPNLFKGIAHCGYCGSNMKYRKVRKQHSKASLHCTQRSGSPCDESYSKHLKYPEFEDEFLEWVTIVDLDKILGPDEDAQADIDREKAIIQRMETELKKVQADVEELEKHMIVPGRSAKQQAKYDAKAEELDAQQIKITKDIDTAEHNLKIFERDLKSVKANQSEIDKLRQRFTDYAGTELYKLRKHVNTVLRGFIKDIVMYPRGVKEGEKNPHICNVIFKNGKFMRVGGFSAYPSIKALEIEFDFDESITQEKAQAIRNDLLIEITRLGIDKTDIFDGDK